MTTATAPRVSREILEERWRAAVTQPKFFTDQSTGLDNSEDWYEWEDAVVAIATRLRGDGLDENERSNVEHIAATIWDDTLRERLLDWAAERAV